MQAFSAPDRISAGAVRKLRILYAIQNVGGIDFAQGIGDTVPVKYTLRGLQAAGHTVSCLQLDENQVRVYEDAFRLDAYNLAAQGTAGSSVFRAFEGGMRRAQRVLGIPYLALLDSYRFYATAWRYLSSFDLIHEHNGLLCIGSALASQRARKPYVLTFSADPILERRLVGRPLTGIQAHLAEREARYTYRVANRILCVSAPAKVQLVETWGVEAEKAVVMPNGVDTDLFSPRREAGDVRARFELDGRAVVSFVGSFQLWHGIDQLVEIFAGVLQEVPASKLLLVGDGPARDRVEEAVRRLDIADSVVITGLVAQESIPAILAAADVAVIPYPKLPRELWFSPLKLYEYMAAGKAIVASRMGQIAEVIQDGQDGHLVEPGDIESFTRAIVRLLKDPAERGRMGMRARQKAVECHSWEQYVQRLEEVYQDAIAHHKLDQGAGGG